MTAVARDAIDRLEPTRRPDARAIMQQRWEDLLFLHWPLPPADVRPLIPLDLELDTFEGRAYVAVVPFNVTLSRLVWAPPLPLLSSFHEVNVRTYVHRNGRDPGVWFYSLDASNPLIVKAARLWYKLPYRYARIQLTSEESGSGGRRRVRFASRRRGKDPADLDIAYGGSGTPQPAPPGTLEHFLVERYILYAASNEAVYQARVHHAPYPLQAAAVGPCRESLLAAAGFNRPDQEPLTHYASAVDVEVFSLRRL